MMRRVLLVTAAFPLLLCACPKPTTEPACTPNASVGCVCANGQSGAQVCNADGSAFLDCVCAGGSSSSAAASSASTASGSSGSATRASSAASGGTSEVSSSAGATSAGNSGTSGTSAPASSASGSSGSSATSATSATSGSSGAQPHPLYPALDLATLPGGGGGATGPYQVPALPVTTRTVTISTSGNQARQDIAAACATPGTHVVVPDAAGSFGTLDLGNVQDCDVELGPQVVMNLLFVGHLPGPTVAPVQRVRVRGGQTGGLIVDPGSTDVVVDGMIINNGVVPSSQRSYTGVLLNSDDLAGTYVNRFALLRSMVRLVPSPPDGGGNRDGTGFLGARARNVLFAGNNIVTSGNRNPGDSALAAETTTSSTETSRACPSTSSSE